MINAFPAAPGIDVLTSTTAIPGLGSIAINAFVLHGEEPVLVDTGAIVQRDEFMAALRSVIDPGDLRWIWLTHPDPDHTGALHQLLAENPRLGVVTTFLGVGIMGLSAPLPLDRVHLLNPGQRLRLADRTLTALRPPVFDNPTTTGFLDDKTGALCSSDCFGALLEEVPDRADEVSPAALRQGQVLWATIDSPWVQRLDESHFARELDALRALEPSVVLSSHLPPAPGAMLESFVGSLAAVPSAPPFVGPDQPVLEQMLAQMAEQAPPRSSRGRPSQRPQPRNRPGVSSVVAAASCHDALHRRMARGSGEHMRAIHRGAWRRACMGTALVAGVVVACSMAAVPAAAAAAPAPAFQAAGSAEQVYVTGLPSSARMSLLTPTGSHGRHPERRLAGRTALPQRPTGQGIPRPSGLERTGVGAHHRPLRPCRALGPGHLRPVDPRQRIHLPHDA